MGKLVDSIGSEDEGKKSYIYHSCDESFLEITELNSHIASTHGVKKPSLKKNFEFTYVNAVSVAKIVKGLKNSSSLGIDKIPTAAWKLGIEILAAPIAKLINLSLSKGIVPKLFKSALVHPAGVYIST